MGNVAPKGTHRFDDDDADFGASFVLSRVEVDDALASGAAQVIDGAEALKPTAPSARRKLVYIGVAIAAAILIGGAALLGL